VFQRLVALTVVVSLACIGPISPVAGDKAGPDGFISQVGTYRLYHGKLTMRIYEDKGKLNHEFITTVSFRTSLFRRSAEKVSRGAAEPWIEKGTNWFAFAELTDAKAPKALWIFNGHDKLVQIAFTDRQELPEGWSGFFAEYGGYESHSDSSPSIVRDAPQAVRDRLPEAFKKKFKDK
jgi:hypothetical protein